MLEDLKPHLADLRKRLVISLVSVLLSFVVCFIFWKDILEYVKEPLQFAYDHGVKGKLIQIAPAEAIFAGIKLSLLASIAISIPIIFWQLWLFVAPGLYKHEKRLVLPFIFFASIMFLLGFLFCYYIVFPLIIKYVLTFGNEVVDADVSIKEYISFFISFMFGFGVAFELPVVAYFLGKIGLITDQTLKGFFRYAVVIIFIIAAILTPPDVLSQLLLAFPMVFLYLIAILILKFVNPEKKIKEDNLYE